MKVVIDTPIGVDEFPWPGSIDRREPLLLIVNEAIKRAAHLHHTVLASFTLPIDVFDPLAAFNALRQAHLGACFYWEQPQARHALLGVGTATTIVTHGRSCITDAASAWRSLLHEAVVTYAPRAASPYASGPLLVGGFAFDPLSAKTDLWAGFPDGLLLLPCFLLSSTAGHAALTINRFVEATDDADHCVAEMVKQVRHLFIALEHLPSSSPFPQEGAGRLPAPPQEQTVRTATENMLSRQEWMELVAEAVGDIRRGEYEKIVLARAVQLTKLTEAGGAATDGFDVGLTLQRLRQNYPGTYVFAFQRGERFFVGATPERLVQAQNGQIQTMALAGSAPRGRSEEEDAQLGDELLHCEKNTLEHALVVSMVRKALLDHCSSVQVCAPAHLLKLKNVQHLETPIQGELLPGRCILDVMANLHPTPAVGGFPSQAALAAIRRMEQLERGWYAGPLGWIGAGGHGEFAVALRSGLIDGKRATLFAGCGIMADSDPQSEYDESCLKLQVMVRGLDGGN